MMAEPKHINAQIAESLGWQAWQDLRPGRGERWFMERAIDGRNELEYVPDYVGLLKTALAHGHYDATQGEIDDLRKALCQIGYAAPPSNEQLGIEYISYSKLVVHHVTNNAAVYSAMAKMAKALQRMVNHISILPADMDQPGSPISDSREALAAYEDLR